uniref:Putative secreted protein n=1 Tax=Anopheles darlingi TaxID=43151 RepID=A0A2M4D815_ANODA
MNFHFSLAVATAATTATAVVRRSESNLESHLTTVTAERVDRAGECCCWCMDAIGRALNRSVWRELSPATPAAAAHTHTHTVVHDV